MLFNSYLFIFAFLPLTLLGFQILSKRCRVEWVMGWLLAASLAFYRHWNPAHLMFLLGSIAWNYCAGELLRRIRRNVIRKALLGAAIAGNLGFLGYFKYASFLIRECNRWLGLGWPVPPQVLPLGISFFTFTQIAYLLHVFQRTAPAGGPLAYSLFVTFFPHLVAGPIVHFRDIFPQMARLGQGIRFKDAWMGLTLFVLGLAKKTLIADTLSEFVRPIFGLANTGAPVRMVEAWLGAFAYGFQIYFDFSGYSDMAIGLALLFGIRFAINFNSPYKAASVIDFWRRWHITLSVFLRDYLYIPLGGNRRGEIRRYLNLAVTMLLGGLWHGAAWTFVVWGAAHGVLLTINHLWRAAVERWGWRKWTERRGMAGVWRGLTFLSVMASWVFFRAESWTAVQGLIWGMFGGNGLALPRRLGESLGGLAARLAPWGITFDRMTENPWIPTAAACGICLVIVWGLPNTQEMVNYTPVGDIAVHQAEVAGETDVRHAARFWRVRPSWPWGMVVGLLLGLAVLRLAGTTEFLYFQF